MKAVHSRCSYQLALVPALLEKTGIDLEAVREYCLAYDITEQQFGRAAIPAILLKDTAPPCWQGKRVTHLLLTLLSFPFLTFTQILLLSSLP